MAVEEGRISASETVLLMIGFLFGSSVLLSPGQAAGTDAWIAILLGVGEGLFFAFGYLMLLPRFPGKTLIQIIEVVFGRFMGFLISVGFLWFVFHLLSLVLVTYLDFLKLAFLTQTPSAVLLLFGVIVCAYTARYGVEVLARCSQILVLLTMFIIIIVTLFVIPQMDMRNIQPILNTPWPKMLKAVHVASTLPFGQTVVFAMILPFINKKNQLTKVPVTATIIAGLFLSFLSFRTAAVLGKTASIYVYPGYNVARLIEIGDAFNRMEILVALNFLTMGFIKVSVLLYTISLGTAQLFKLDTYRALVLPIGILVIILTLSNFSNVVENFFFAQEVYPYYALPFIAGIPYLTLGTAMIRKLPKGERR